MPRPRAIWSSIATLFAAGLLHAALALPDPTPTPTPTLTRQQASETAVDGPSARWQAGAACEDCHPGIVASYRSSAMARAMEPLAHGEAAELAQLSAAGVPSGAEGLRFGFESRRSEAGDELELVERQARNEAVTPVARSRVAFAIGAGVLDRSYVLERGGALYFAPLERLSAAHSSGVGERAGAAHGELALAPAHSINPALRSFAPITDECMACHTSVLGDARVPLHAVPAAPWTVSGIDCASCHGDGAAHVEWRTAALEGQPASGPDPILNPARFEPRARLSVCGRCHLQGDARLSLERGRRGHAALGSDMFESTALFGAAEPTLEIGFVSHFERMLESPCFLGVELGELACQTCHDPHGSLEDPAERSRARAGCTSCHPRALAADLGAEREPVRKGAKACSRDGSSDPPLADCVACHMRRTSVFDVARVAIHDHRVERKASAPSAFERVRIHQATSPRLRRWHWPGATPPLAGDPGLLMVALAAADERAAAREHVDAPVDARVARLNVYQHVRATLLEELGRLEEARLAYERSLLLDPDWSESLINLAGVLIRLDRPQAAKQRLDAALERSPLLEGAWRNRSLAKLRLGDPRGARADLEQAFRILPRASTAHGLAQLARAAGDAAALERWAALAQDLAP